MQQRAELVKQLEHHTAEAARIRTILERTEEEDWRPAGFYMMYHLTAGAILGCLAAGVSLMWNVMGATLLLPQKPALYLIQVYLTFGLGERALALEPGQASGFLYFVGCLLYIATGGFYGIILQLVLQGALPGKSWVQRGIASIVFGILLWVFNFYIVLPVLQPMLFGGNWIFELTPWYVGASTHLIFAMAFFLMSTWGRFDNPGANRSGKQGAAS